MLITASKAIAGADPFDIVGFFPYLRCEDAIANDRARGAVPFSPWKLNNAVHALFGGYTLKLKLDGHDYDLSYLCDGADATGGWVMVQIFQAHFATREEAQAERDRVERSLTNRLGAPCFEWQPSEVGSEDDPNWRFARYTFWNAGDRLVTTMRGSFSNTQAGRWQLSFSTELPPEFIGADSATQESWDRSSCNKDDGRILIVPGGAATLKISGSVTAP